MLVHLQCCHFCCGCGSSADTPQSSQTGESAAAATETPTEPQVLDITKEYANFPYTNDFAITRKAELDSLNDLTIYHISSSDQLPQFYKNFFTEYGKFNVTFETFNYDLTRENVKDYFDSWEYRRFANWGTTKVIDSLVIEDDTTLSYYSYYVTTVLGDNGDSDVASYYYDLAAVDKTSKAITQQENVAIKEKLTVPKSISGDNDFSNVI